jgi:elongation factor 1-alpha
MIEKSNNLGRFTGGAFPDAIDSLEPPKRPCDKPHRLPVRKVYNISGFGRVAS